MPPFQPQFPHKIPERNVTAMLDYRLYKTYFPVWALGKYLANRAATS